MGGHHFGGHAGGGGGGGGASGGSGGGGAGGGAAPWELVKAAGAALPLGHLGREKAGNAEITPLQVGGRRGEPPLLPPRRSRRACVGGLGGASAFPCWPLSRDSVARHLALPAAARPPGRPLCQL